MIVETAGKERGGTQRTKAGFPVPSVLRRRERQVFRTPWKPQTCMVPRGDPLVGKNPSKISISEQGELLNFNYEGFRPRATLRAVQCHTSPIFPSFQSLATTSSR